mmetsp:Transcript_45689/g.72270  ORF Transcript_45689/g.72270 Transcript_45689/m.72270 type:complete len:592 (+) Transcript_45689:115-1890(+)
MPFGAEQCATEVVQAIVANGGHQVEQHYLNRKSFPFARNAGIELALCGRDMCNPNHEQADLEDDWALEDDVRPLASDNWIRMSLPRPKTAPDVTVSRAPSLASQGLPKNFRPKSAPGAGIRKRLTPSSQNSETSSHTSRSGSKFNIAQVPSASASSSVARSSDTKRVVGSLHYGKRDDRAFSIPDLNVIDEDDEKVRREQARQANQKLKEEELKKQRILEEEAEVRRQEEKRLAEVQDRRPRTYDSAGRIIWIQEQNPEELPTFHECFDIDVETSPNDRLKEIPLMSNLPVKRPLLDAKAEKKDAKKGFERRLTKKASSTLLRRSSRTKTDDFTDGFYRHECMQPPVTETMKMRSGVLLECMGIKKSAPLAHKVGQRMSRTEYLNLIRRRDQGDSSVVESISDAGSTDTTHRKSSKVRPQSAPAISKNAGMSISMRLSSNDEKDASAAAPCNEEDAESLVALAYHPPCPPSRTPLFMGTIHPEMNQKAPPAPFIRLRNKERSLTGDAQPRNRGTFIGSVNTQSGRIGPIQPVLGAVMGHGLLRSVSKRDDFYFPHFPASPGHTSAAQSSPPSARIRTSSEPISASRSHARR